MINKIMPYLQGLARSVTGEKKYDIRKGYIHRTEYNYFNDTVNTDNWQKEVYEKASSICEANGLKTVVDVGCGSAFKLIHYLGKYECKGVDVPETVSWLKKKYPEREWLSFEEVKAGGLHADLVICSDVIEHVLDPDELLTFIKSVNPRWIVISTPDRNLVPFAYRFGPPENPTHIREWAFEEFRRYIERYFVVTEHQITNKEQGTQMVVCKVR
ncbi:MAG TPA: methyltransferase domain-containing protein [Chitinophagaceae bacterium]|nr:methyltransferase domain-containing protein [Chitinophagaceae bacterium]